MKISYNGLPLIRRSQANLEWLLNTSHTQKMSKQGYDLLVEICNNLRSGIENLYHPKRPDLLKHVDILFDELIIVDPVAQAVDLRLVHNLLKNEILNEERIIKAPNINYCIQ